MHKYMYRYIIIHDLHVHVHVHVFCTCTCTCEYSKLKHLFSDSQVFLGPGARVGTGEVDRTSSLEVLREMGGTSTSMTRNLYGAEIKGKKTDILKRACEIFIFYVHVHVCS